MKRSRVLSLILVILVFPASTVCAQQQVYGCVKNANGQIRIVAAGEACLPSEHPVQWAAGGSGPVVVPPSTPGPLRVLDQNGATVGVFVPSGYAAKQVGDVWVALPVLPTGFQVTAATGFMAFYQNADCSGDAYLQVDTTTLLRTGVVMADSNTGGLAFSFAGKPEVDRATIQAYARYVGGAWTCYGGYTPQPWMTLFGKVATVDLKAYQAPFKIVQ